MSRVAAAMTPPRPDCVTENTSGTVEMAQLCNALLDELLSTMLLNHVQQEAVVRGSLKGCWIWTALSTAKVLLLLLSRSRLCRSSSVGCWGWKSSLRCQSVCQLQVLNSSCDGVLAVWQ